MSKCPTAASDPASGTNFGDLCPIKGNQGQLYRYHVARDDDLRTAIYVSRTWNAVWNPYLYEKDLDSHYNEPSYWIQNMDHFHLPEYISNSAIVHPPLREPSRLVS
ncbi:hypothetical protein BC939DRAFT_478160 [Gamsiella multidivaricata]|uniref:uncharacterized protein n=1 Tax=Gamsiella multidivaricata TaxID=101098 RepID=UPI0022207293|nr:uncharacterized protein BC939DRAFT_478160 [Gamsiella multidivaricata]KAI7821696.1 hypothetical protein BC939DRAFT_478160 [Gamsiella multidivaricata]